MAFGCLPVAGQEKAAMKTGLGEYVPEQSVELRAESGLRDSLITYSSAGEKLVKRDYTPHDGGWIYSRYDWHGNVWVYSGEGNDYGTPVEFVESTNTLYFPLMGARSERHKLDTWFDGNDPDRTVYYPVFPAYDERGRVSLIRVKGEPYQGMEYFVSYAFTYNEYGQIASILDWNYDWKKRQIDYRYNERGDMILVEDYGWKYGNTGDPSSASQWLWDTSFRMVAKYGSQGRKVREERYLGNQALQKYLLNEYDVFYYSDGYTPSISTGNNNPVSDTNKGGFDVNIAVPADSVAGGSFVVKLPDGFTLDETATQPGIDFDGFTLVITKQEDNSWFLAFRPEDMRSAALRSEDVARTLVHIACTVDGQVKRGTYDVTVHSILFETPGGDAIVEPALTVPVQLNRWGAGNEAVAGAEIRGYAGNLYVRTPQPAALHVYTAAGTLCRQQALPAGETAVPLPRGTYVVKVGDVTAKIAITN
jgi:hypothetical protein